MYTRVARVAADSLTVSEFCSVPTVLITASALRRNAGGVYHRYRNCDRLDISKRDLTLAGLTWAMCRNPVECQRCAETYWHISHAESHRAISVHYLPDYHNTMSRNRKPIHIPSHIPEDPAGLADSDSDSSSHYVPPVPSSRARNVRRRLESGPESIDDCTCGMCKHDLPQDPSVCPLCVCGWCASIQPSQGFHHGHG